MHFFFTVFTAEFAFKLRGKFGPGLLRHAGTVRNLRTLGDELNIFCILKRQGHNEIIWIGIW
jgi:hypothetical protein